MIGETVTCTRKGAANGTPDVRGNSGYAADSTVTFTGVAVAPGGTDEIVDSAGTRVFNEYTLYFPTGSVVYPTDKFTVRSVAGYLIDGEGKQWTSPYDSVGKGVVVRVRKAS